MYINSILRGGIIVMSMISKILREIREANEAVEKGAISDKEFDFLKNQALSQLLPEGQEFYTGPNERMTDLEQVMSLVQMKKEEVENRFGFEFNLEGVGPDQMIKVIINKLIMRARRNRVNSVMYNNWQKERDKLENCLFDNYREIYADPDNDKSVIDNAIDILEDYSGQDDLEKPHDRRKDPKDPEILAAGVLKSELDRRKQDDKKDIFDLAEELARAKKESNLSDINLKPLYARPCARPSNTLRDTPVSALGRANKQLDKLAEYLEDVGFDGPGVDPVATAIHLLDRSGFNAEGETGPKYDFDIADFEEVKNQIGRYDYISNTRGLDSELKVEGLFFAEDFQILADHLRAVAGNQE